MKCCHTAWNDCTILKCRGVCSGEENPLGNAEIVQWLQVLTVNSGFETANTVATTLQEVKPIPGSDRHPCV